MSKLKPVNDILALHESPARQLHFGENYAQELGKKARGLKYLDHVLMTAGILAFNRRESPEGWETCESPSGGEAAHPAE